MSDIADKIYAATGLTLGAEEAAKIGQMIQQARRNALEEAMEIAFNERFCVERYETRPPQAIAAHNIIEAIRALGEKE